MVFNEYDYGYSMIFLANTCNKVRLLELIHLLDKSLMRAMSIALMIHDNSVDSTTIMSVAHHTNF